MAVLGISFQVLFPHSEDDNADEILKQKFYHSNLSTEYLYYYNKFHFLIQPINLTSTSPLGKIEIELTLTLEGDDNFRSHRTHGISSLSISLQMIEPISRIIPRTTFAENNTAEGPLHYDAKWMDCSCISKSCQLDKMGSDKEFSFREEDGTVETNAKHILMDSVRYLNQVILFG